MGQLILKRFIQIGITALLQAAILMAAAGRFTWTWAWAYICLYILAVAVNALVLLPRRPELIAERAEVKQASTRGSGGRLIPVYHCISREPS